MSETPATTARGRVPCGLLGMLALIACVEWAASRHAVDVTPWGAWAWRLSGEAAWGRAASCEVLCLGDSLVKMGVLPRVIEARTGISAYNLAICAGQAPASYFSLRRALDAGARPSALLVDFKPSILAASLRNFERTWPEFLTLLECLELSWTASDPTFFAATALAILSPTVRARIEIRTNILLALRGEPGIYRSDTLRYRRNWDANLGAQVTARNPRFTGSVLELLHKQCMSDVWWCNRINLAYIRRFLALAAARDIPVYWLLPPLAPELQARRERSGADAQHTRFVRGLQASFPNLTVVDGRHSGYEPPVFFDPVHLDRRGACAYSAALADLIARTDTEGRWFTLPPYRDTPIDVALEEIDQTTIVLKNLGTEARR
jgi:hypothetical protein